jgi:hypothetical protein
MKTKVVHSISQENVHLSWNQRFITVIVRGHHRFLFWARRIQSTPINLTSLRSTLILSSHLRLGLPTGLLLSVNNNNNNNTHKDDHGSDLFTRHLSYNCSGSYRNFYWDECLIMYVGLERKEEVVSYLVPGIRLQQGWRHFLGTWCQICINKVPMKSDASRLSSSNIAWWT